MTLPRTPSKTMNKSKVYFAAVKDNEPAASIIEKIKALLKASRLLDFVEEKENVAIKMHFGEEGNTGFVRPEQVRVVSRAVFERGAIPFLSDANTLYRGRRLNTRDHLLLAHEHGFRRDSAAADIIIPDDSLEGNSLEIAINQKHIKKARIARFFIDVDDIVAVSHFKGHILTGFGGAIKNIGMGCATREGKLAQHCDVAPVVHVENCTGCGECALVCPTGAIKIVAGKSSIDKPKCVGCTSCMAACPTMAMFVDFEAGESTQEKMAEYALAVLKDKKNKSAFLNFALRINKECDCWGADNPRIAPDVGIFASLDPVSIDKASFDMVNKVCGKDIFKETHPDQDGLRQLRYAREIGLGSLDYELIEIY